MIGAQQGEQALFTELILSNLALDSLPSQADTGGMIVRFPDTLTVRIPDNFLIKPAQDLKTAPPPLTFFAVQGYTGLGAAAFTFASYSPAEQAYHLKLIREAFRQGVGFLDLPSMAPLPTTGDNASGDIFPNGAQINTAPYAVVANQWVLFSIGTDGTAGTGATAQIGPAAPGQAAALVASFQFGGKMSIVVGGVNKDCAPTHYVDATRMLARMPANIGAGVYGLVYSDGRGSVTKAAAIQY